MNFCFIEIRLNSSRTSAGSTGIIYKLKDSRMTFISIHPGKCEWMSGSVKTPGWQWLLSSHPNYGSEHNIAHIVGNKDDSSCPVEASFNVATHFSSQGALFFSSGRKCLILVSLRKAAWQSCHKQPRDLSLNHMCTTPPQCTIRHHCHGVQCNIYQSFAVCFAIGECAIVRSVDLCWVQ